MGVVCKTLTKGKGRRAAFILSHSLAKTTHGCVLNKDGGHQARVCLSVGAPNTLLMNWLAGVGTCK